MVMRIQERRIAKRMTQRELGIEMGVDCSAVTKWETEAALPKARDLPQLARVLGCTINDLFVDAPEPEAI